MSDKPANNRPQINIRLDKEPTLLDEIKKAASDHNITASEFLLDAIKSAFGKPTTTTPSDTPSLESIKAEINQIIDSKLDKRLGEFERRLLEQVRPIDRPENRQPPPEELIEDRQVSEEVRPEARPDYQAIRLRILKSLRTRVATTSPQYKTATKVLDSFISEIQADAEMPKSD